MVVMAGLPLLQPGELLAQFRWSNPITEEDHVHARVKHATFRSPSMELEVGYCIFFPPGYEESKLRYPVIYIFHGGKDGSNEKRHVKIATFVSLLLERKKEPMPAIYVFVNGGAVAYYDYPAKNSLGETVFIEELIPHIDKTYRTIADRSGRGIEGYSGGGRAVARIGFGYPELFGSAIAGCGGYNFEKDISETGERGNYKDFLPGHNAYDRAKEYAKTKEPELPFLVACGTADPWYETNVDYMKYLDELGIPYEKLIAEGGKHGPQHLYGEAGLELIRYHKRNLAKPALEKGSEE